MKNIGTLNRKRGTNRATLNGKRGNRERERVEREETDAERKFGKRGNKPGYIKWKEGKYDKPQIILKERKEVEIKIWNERKQKKLNGKRGKPRKRGNRGNKYR